MKLIKHVANGRPDLKFWAQKDTFGGRTSWAVVSAADGYPAGEAHDDWFANFKDADEVAKELAETYSEES